MGFSVRGGSVATYREVSEEAALTYYSTPRGIVFPYWEPPSVLNSIQMDATTEKGAYIGRLYIDGRPTTSKTLSAAGGGSIAFRTGSTTFAATAPASTLDIGIQGVATGSGPIGQPDGVYTVSRTLTSGVDTITGSTWNTFAMTGGSGSASLTHGDLIAIVWDLTARNGADSIIIVGQNAPLSLTAGANCPVTNAFVAGAWQTTAASGAARWPNALITFDDGTIATIDTSLPFLSFTSESFSDSTNPDERGLIFQVPWSCKIDALWAYAGAAVATGDFTIKLYSSPTSSPSLLASVDVLAEQGGVAGVTNLNIYALANEVSLTRATDYAVTIRATGAGNARLYAVTLANQAHRALYPGGTNMRKGSRQNDTGAFTEESPAVTIYGIGVRISQLQSD